MSFKLKFDLEAAAIGYVSWCKLARESARKSGEPFPPGITDRDEAANNEQDISIGQELARQEMAQLQSFMDDYVTAQGLVIPCKEFVYPHSTYVRFLDFQDSRQISLEALFFQLDIRKFELGQVFKKRDGILRGDRYTGLFWEDGRQHLANLLDKEVTFYKQSPMSYLDTPETFSPKLP